MTHFERLFAALWVSEQWFVAAEYKSPKQALHYRARGIVVFDRILNCERTLDAHHQNI